MTNNILHNYIKTNSSSLYIGKLLDDSVAEDLCTYMLKLPYQRNLQIAKRTISFFSDNDKGYPLTSKWCLKENKYFCCGKISTYITLDILRNKIKQLFDIDVNNILVDTYENENDYRLQHSLDWINDNEQDKEKKKRVVCIFLGCSRTFRITTKELFSDIQYNKEVENTKKQEFTLDIKTTNGEFVLMDGEFQKEFYHGIPKPLQSQIKNGECKDIFICITFLI